GPSVPERRSQFVMGKRTHGCDVRDRDITVRGRLEGRGQRRAHRDNERRAGRTVSEHREPAGVYSSVVRLLAQPEVGATVASECLPKQPVGFVHVSGDVDRPAGKRRDERDVLGRLVRAPLVRCVVRRADADEDGAEVVVAEVELEHLVRALDEERRVRVRDRTVALECETGRDADHQLLAYADVEVTRMLADRLVPYLRGDDGDPFVLVERLAGELVEAFAHRRHLASTSATMQRGRVASGSGASAASSASWSRPSTRCAVQPSSMKRRSIPSGQPCSDESLSTTIAVSEASPIRPAYCTASQFDPSSSSPSPP